MHVGEAQMTNIEDPVIILLEYMRSRNDKIEEPVVSMHVGETQMTNIEESVVSMHHSYGVPKTSISTDCKPYVRSEALI